MILCIRPRLVGGAAVTASATLLARRGLEQGQSPRNTLDNQLLRHHVRCASTHVMQVYCCVQALLVDVHRECQPNIEASIGMAPLGKSNGSQVGIQHLPEPVTTRNRVRRWLKKFTRDVSDKMCVKIRKMWQRCQENTTQWQTRLVPQKHTADAAAKKWCSRKCQIVKKNAKKQHRLCSRSARCADNQRGGRCCAHASTRCRKKLFTRVLCGYWIFRL